MMGSARLKSLTAAASSSQSSTSDDSISPKKPQNTNSCIASRNGVILTWADIYQQYSDEIKDGQEIHKDMLSECPPMDSSTLLQLLPRGAYTTCRTVRNGTHIYQFDYHVKRLALSARSILETISSTSGENNTKSKIVSEKTESGDKKEDSHQTHHHKTPSKVDINGLKIVDVEWERKMAMSCIQSTLDAFRTSSFAGTDNITIGDDPDAEFRITLLSTWEELQQHKNDTTPFQSVLYCHVGLLPQSNSTKSEPNQKHIKVLVHGHGRDNALAKDSKWVSDRKQYTAEDPSPKTASSSESLPTYEEIILINDYGEMLEGSQTNFYVVTDRSESPSESVENPTIITANDGILYGSVRDSVLRVCRSHNIAVELRPPTLADLKHASGVFITSTSRMVMPIHEVVLGDLLLFNNDNNFGDDGGDDDVDTNEKKSNDTLPPSYHYLNCRTTENIRKWVLEDVETHSTPIYLEN